MSAPRLTIVSSYFSPHVGGVETMAFEQARGLAGLGWDVEVVTSRLGRDGAVEIHDGVLVRRVRALNPLEARFHVPIPLVAPSFGRVVVRRDRRPDLVLIHGHVYLTSVMAAITCRRSSVPYVLLQSNPFVDYPRPIELVERAVDRLIGRRVLEAAWSVLAISGYTADYVRRIADVGVSIVHCGVDTGRFHPAAAPTVPPWQVVTVRRLVDRNGVDVLVDAWRRAGLGDDDAAELVIGGSGPERARLESRAEGMPNVRFAGYVPDDSMADLYRSASVAVMPTRSGEGFGLMAAEALASGTPVVASNQGALPEVVRDGVDGVLVAPDDPEALAAVLRRLRDDPAGLARLRGATTESDFSWQRNVAELDHHLRAELSRSELRAPR